MRILQVHKYLYQKAGAERYFFDVSKLLLQNGHTVGVWGTKEKYDEKVIQHELEGVQVYKDLLVNEIHFNRREGGGRDLHKGLHFVYSIEAARKFYAMIKRFQPDIIHVHNIYHHLTPSILSVARRTGIPVVMTVHDWSLVNPNYSLFDHGAVCERKGVRAIMHRCIQNSMLATALAVFAHGLERFLRINKRAIKAYLVPVPFAMKKLRQAKIPSQQVHVLPYPLSVESPCGAHRQISEPFVLYAGRLSAEKGIGTLIAAAQALPQIHFVVAGSGPEEEALKAEAITRNVRNVQFLGFVERKKLYDLICRARLVVVPSLWYDVSPYAVLEPQAIGKAVLASKIGGIPELIEDGKTGFLFPAGNSTVLAAKIEMLMAHARMLDTVGRAAQERIYKLHDREAHYRELIALYEKVLAA